MAIIGNELNLYQPKVVNDTASNGGRISTTLITSGLANTWWPNVTETQLTSGIIQWRKSFLRVDNSANETASSLKIGLWRPTVGSDQLYLAKGTQTNIQSEFGSPDLYGSGTLDSPVLTGANTFDVLVEDGTVIIFRDGDIVRISSETSLGVGTAEVHTINGTPTVNGDVVTIVIDGVLANDYSSTDTYVSSLIEETDVKTSVINKTVTSTAGVFNENLMIVGNLGSIYQILTFTFTSATAFVVSSDEGITLAGGTIGSTYAPTNMAVGASYCSVSPSCWGGTFVAGDTVVLTTVPPCVPILEKRVIQPGSTAFNSQSRILTFFVES